ncbi:MAG: hypothetical protein EOM24_02620, partial [Chloroflexia bacterium]|nr:hypothetical protein [Chloroflexia bacterium]
MNVTVDGVAFDDTERRRRLQESRFNGIDYLEVDATPGETNQRILRVYFIAPGPAAPSAKVTTMLNDLDGQAAAFEIRGGDRVRNIRILAVRRVENHLELRVSQPGDFSDYSLKIRYAGGAAPNDFPLDRFYAEVNFNFKAGCPSRFDCRQFTTCPPEPGVDLFVDYMAKDFDSFRQELIDLLPRLIPDWIERRIADQGMMLLELLSYVGDQLSYYQDAVANEAYLETARQRISVRRHAQLIDYPMHDGLSARTVMQLQVKSGGMTIAAPSDNDRILRVMTQPQGIALPNVIPAERADDALNATSTVFEIRVQDDAPLKLHARLNMILLYNWGNQVAYLPPGATSADLLLDHEDTDEGPLQAGALLLFEELLDPFSGSSVTADPRRRRLIRITRVEHIEDTLSAAVPLTRIHWAEEDALPFSVWISNVTADDLTLPLNRVAYVPSGATSADLLLDHKGTGIGSLQAGAQLLFEELLDPSSGSSVTADPRRRRRVRITHVEHLQNTPSAVVPLTRVHWAEEDALPFRVWISNVTAEGVALPLISVARGNLAIADQGRTIEEWHPHNPTLSSEWRGLKPGSRAFRFTLREGPLAQSIPMQNLRTLPAAALFSGTPLQA